MARGGKRLHYVIILGKIEAQSFAKIEGLSPEVFSFHNEFWVSYYIVRELFDKKFIVSPFKEYSLEKISELDLMGVYAK